MKTTTIRDEHEHESGTDDRRKQEGDHEAIVAVIHRYLDGARSGEAAIMKPAFHSDATIYGYFGDDLLAGNIDLLFAWNDENGPATGLEARIASVDIANTAATVRLEVDDWTGYRFTDMFTLLKIEGHWKIVNKVFHLHS